MNFCKHLTGLFLGTVCAIGSASGAAAADAVVDKAVILEPGFSWTGLYIGANVGYSWGDLAAEIPIDDSLQLLATDSDGVSGGLTGGVQIGYNWQLGNFVLGVEADAQAADVQGSAWQFFDFASLIVEVQAATRVDWFGTARLRLGYVPNERLLIYGTGGLAFGETTTDASLSVRASNFHVSRSEKKSRTGWAAGAGAEYAFADNWTVKAEYLYTDLGEENVNEALVATGLDSEVKFHTLRLGVNYKF